MGLSVSSTLESALDQLKDARKSQAEPQRVLAQLEIVSVLLKVDLTDRDYRNDFTPNYRVLFDRPGRRLYIYELFNCFDCEPIYVNGKVIRISQEARNKGRNVKRCYHELLETLDAYFLAGLVPDLEKMRTMLARFDRTWVDFEKLYFEELFKIEAEARAPVVKGMQLEAKLRSLEANDNPCTPWTLEVAKLVGSIRAPPSKTSGYNERFQVLKQLVQLAAGLNSCANISGRGREDLDIQVLEAAAERLTTCMKEKTETQLELYNREVQRVLALRVLGHFSDVRKYFASITDIWKEVDPQLCNNRKLVEALAAWEVAWELGQKSLLKQDVLHSFSSCAAMTLDAQRLAPALPRLIDTRDAELFMILPRLVIMSGLLKPDESGILRELLPHQFPEDWTDADAETTGEGTRSSLTELREDFQQLQQVVDKNPKTELEYLTMQVIAGPNGAECGNRQIRNFLLSLEGLSLELQRFRPADWNQICSALLECIEAVSGRSACGGYRGRDLTPAGQEPTSPDFEASASLRRAMRPWCF
mmetsp:Transcript_40416/g.93801  ORF Transcript_40416/g.93801 Transcript_40416/m.93801 type:complete len:532 (-) Transcript_40416:21-1616(-)